MSLWFSYILHIKSYLFVCIFECFKWTIAFIKNFFYHISFEHQFHSNTMKYLNIGMLFGCRIEFHFNSITQPFHWHLCIFIPIIQFNASSFILHTTLFFNLFYYYILHHPPSPIHECICKILIGIPWSSTHQVVCILYVMCKFQSLKSIDFLTQKKGFFFANMKFRNQHAKQRLRQIFTLQFHVQISALTMYIWWLSMELHFKLNYISFGPVYPWTYKFICIFTFISYVCSSHVSFSLFFLYFSTIHFSFSE